MLDTLNIYIFLWMERVVIIFHVDDHSSEMQRENEN